MAWITVEDLGAMLGKTIASGPEVALAEALVAGACTVIKEVTNRDLEAADYTKTLHGHGGAVLFLPQYPVISVTSVAVDGVTIPPRATPGGAGWTADDAAIYLSGGYRFTKGASNVVVTFRAGYEAAAFPADLKWAALELAALRWKQRANLGALSRNLGGEVVTFDRSEWPDSVAAVINERRNVVPL